MKTQSQTNLPLHRMAVFTPGRLNDDEILGSYIARHAQLELVLEDIKNTRSQSIPQHHLIIGQRGMGKTTLLMRLHVAMRQEPLADAFIPLGFPEEQYSVDRLSALFLNCLDALADTLEREEASQDLIDRIDAAVQNLRQDTAADEIVAQDAERTLMDFAAEIGRRPVLLMDNLDLVFHRLNKPELHQLRAFLMKNGAPILIGAAVHPPEDDYEAPFYDHFKIHFLSRLSLPEMQEVLLKLAERTGNKEIPARLSHEQGRLHALHALTGGNPRTTRILFEIFAHGFSQDAYQDLEALLDWMTPIYKARFEELSDQAQVVVSAIATIWEPAMQKTICDATRLQPNQVSPQLDRLKKAGIIEEVTVDPPERVGPIPEKRTPKDRKGYQIAERFFNIWFLMRQATRRDKRNLIYLTRLIECLHTPQERQQLALDLLGKNNLGRADQVFGLALEPTLMSISQRADLKDHIYDAMVMAKRQFNENIEGIIDPSEIPHHQWEIAELRDKMAAIVSGSSMSDRMSVANEILACPMLVEQRALLVEMPPDQKQMSDLVKRVRQFRIRSEKVWGKDDWQWFERLLNTGSLFSLESPGVLSIALERAETPNRCLIIISFASREGLHEINHSAWKHVQMLLAPTNENKNAADWRQWAMLLQSEFGKYEDAVIAYQKALKIDPKNTHTWNQLGILHFYDTKRPLEARAAFEASIEADGANHHAWHNLANTYCQHLNMPDEAVSAYEKSISLAPDFDLAWQGLGTVLQKNLKQHDKAIDCFRMCIEINENNFVAWNNLGHTLEKGLSDLDQAQECYYKSIQLNPEYGIAHANLANLLSTKGNIENALVHFKKATDLAPGESWIWKSYGSVLQDKKKDYTLAAHAYRNFLRIEPQDSGVWNTLGNLLLDYIRNPDEAQSAFEQAIATTAGDAACAECNLAYLYAMVRQDFTKANSLLEKALASEESKGIEDGIELISAVVDAMQANWGDASRHLRSAFTLLGERKSFPSNTIDDWMRASSVMFILGYGTKLLELAETTGAAQRLRPWFEALRAHVRGDRKYLRNAPAEVRESAGQLFDEIAIRLKDLPQAGTDTSTKQPKNKRSGK